MTIQFYYKTITIGAGAGTCISMSDDQNWIYVGDPTKQSSNKT